MLPVLQAETDLPAVPRSIGRVAGPWPGVAGVLAFAAVDFGRLSEPALPAVVCRRGLATLRARRAGEDPEQPPVRHAWRDHVENALGATVFAIVCGLTWRLPVSVMVFLAALCAFGAATVLQLVRWLLRRLRG
jgi:hypothetical protein